MKLFQICRMKWWLILCCAVLAACEMTMLSRAEETKKLSDIAAFTGIALCYIDENGMPEEEMVQDGALIEKDARLALRYTYEIPEEKISANKRRADRGQDGTACTVCFYRRDHIGCRSGSVLSMA